VETVGKPVHSRSVALVSRCFGPEKRPASVFRCAAQRHYRLRGRKAQFCRAFENVAGPVRAELPYKIQGSCVLALLPHHLHDTFSCHHYCSREERDQQQCVRMHCALTHHLQRCVDIVVQEEDRVPPRTSSSVGTLPVCIFRPTFFDDAGAHLVDGVLLPWRLSPPLLSPCSFCHLREPSEAISPALPTGPGCGSDTRIAEWIRANVPTSYLSPK
jgi:hypothetical protein